MTAIFVLTRLFILLFSGADAQTAADSLSPVLFLTLILADTLLALAITSISYFIRSGRLLCESTRLGLQFSHPDRFLLSKRVAEKLPVPGAAEVKVRDVAYSRTDRGLLCVMSVSYTIGTLGRRRHKRSVCIALDPGGKDLQSFDMLEGLPSPALYAQGYEKLKSNAP